MRILVVGDGPRDQHALPTLVCRILAGEHETRFDDWHQVRVQRQRGTIYARKVKYLTRRAIADGFVALAIVVDTDKANPRTKLRSLREGREDDRQKNPPFPTALGEATPHFDVWLLDDPVAIREALKLPADLPIPAATKTADPKSALSDLLLQSEEEFPQVAEALGAIARCLSMQRCVHRKVTGLTAFEEDVRHEFQPAVSGSS